MEEIDTKFLEVTSVVHYPTDGYPVYEFSSFLVQGTYKNDSFRVILWVTPDEKIHDWIFLKNLGDEKGPLDSDKEIVQYSSEKIFETPAYQIVRVLEN